MTDTVWKTAKETAQMLGVSQQRVCKLAREGRFGTMAYKKYAKELNFNGAWMIGFPNDYKKKPVGQPRKTKAIHI
tara:strand:- start:573 stop:797 length:225 start_codon:yes stop_codon:yes gene_type:complete